MAYYLDLFSPETYGAYKASDRTVSGFRERHRAVARRIRPGDKLVCYLTRLSRWFGILEVIDGPFEDTAPIFVPHNDPFIVRFHVKPNVILDVENCPPMRSDEVWDALSFTKNMPRGSTEWSVRVRGSLARLQDSDGQALERILKQQANGERAYPLSEEETKRLRVHTINRPDKVVTVSVPEETKSIETVLGPGELRESSKMQALLADIGAKMGLSIWIPKADRNAVLSQWNPAPDRLLDRLPLNYDDTTLRTIEQIDVLWLKSRSIIRAFEVEHTTSVYSGILRMADLLALQPNMNIKLHIVAPAIKRDKVFQEIQRPVFALLERGPLAEICSYLSYDSLVEIAQQKHLAHLSDSVLDDYAETPDE